MPTKFGKRILLKISGEVLMGNQAFGIDLAKVGALADEVMAIFGELYVVEREARDHYRVMTLFHTGFLICCVAEPWLLGREILGIPGLVALTNTRKYIP